MELIYIFFGFLLGLVPGWLARKRRLKSHWGALSVEIELCAERAEKYLVDNVMAPLYRLPTGAFRHSFPLLLQEGDLDPDEVRILSRFYGQIEDVNRGLDQAADVMSDPARLQQEYSRNRLKCDHLVNGQHGQQSLYDPARKAVAARLSQEWYKPLLPVWMTQTSRAVSDKLRRGFGGRP